MTRLMDQYSIFFIIIFSVCLIEANLCVYIYILYIYIYIFFFTLAGLRHIVQMKLIWFGRRCRYGKAY